MAAENTQKLLLCQTKRCVRRRTGINSVLAHTCIRVRNPAGSHRLLRVELRSARPLNFSGASNIYTDRPGAGDQLESTANVGRAKPYVWTRDTTASP
jgi:hypothetical protein